MDNSVLFSKRIKSPCKGCEDRWSECHSHCETYLEYERKKFDLYKEIFKESTFEQEQKNIIRQRNETFKRLRSRKRPRR